MNFKMVLLFYVSISLFKRIFELILFYHYICIEYFLDPELTVCLRVNTVKLDVKYMRMGETRLFFFFSLFYCPSPMKCIPVTYHRDIAVSEDSISEACA